MTASKGQPKITNSTAWVETTSYLGIVETTISKEVKVAIAFTVEPGNDSLYGGSGDDILIGGRGSGSDVLSGGLGDDVFIFHRGFGTDTISDFDVFDSTDIIDVSRISDFDGFEDLMENHVTQVGADTLIEDGNGNSILLENVNSADLSADDFLFS